MLPQYLVEQRSGGFVIAVSAAFGLRNDTVDATEFAKIFGGDTECIRRQCLLACVPPHDGCATFRGDNGINGVFHHQDAVTDRDGQCAATTAFSGNHTDNGDLQS